jgi:uncharacterized protein DUF6600
MTKRWITTLTLIVIAAFTGGCAGTYWGGSATVRGSSGGYVNAEAGADYFYDALAPYGTWADVEPYGWVWCPLDVSAGWRPYTVGYWSYTDWGWMWMAQDPWGSVPYQYGRWAFDASVGWLWVPGDVWAPAWVSWRYGDGWVGWAPLPPEATWRVGVGLTYGSSTIDDRIDRDSWCFVPARDFTSTRISARLLPPSRNITLISVTQNVTNYTIIDGRPAERGLRPDMLERESGRPIPKYRVTETTTPRGGRGMTRRGQTIEVFRPRVEPGQNSDDRLREPPPERVRRQPTPEMVQRQERERPRLEDRMREERARLASEQERELRSPPKGVSMDELRQRHQAEMRAQEEREGRERQALEKRNERIRQWMEQRRARGQEEKKDQSRHHGRGHGQDTEDN